MDDGRITASGWVKRSPRPSVVGILNALLTMHYRSLAMYVLQADAWAPSDPAVQRAQAALRNLVDAQQRFAARFAEAILDRDGIIDLRGFPIEFTELNLLSFDFLVKEIIRRQRQEIVQIERLAAQLDGDPAAQALAEEALGSARGHLQNLEEALRDGEPPPALRLTPAAIADHQPTHDQR